MVNSQDVSVKRFVETDAPFLNSKVDLILLKSLLEKHMLFVVSDVVVVQSVDKGKIVLFLFPDHESFF